MKRTIIKAYQFTMKAKYILKQMGKNLKKMDKYDIAEGICTLLFIILTIWTLLSWGEIAHKSLKPNPEYSPMNWIVWWIRSF